MILLTDKEIASVEIKPIVVEGETDAYIISFSVGVQHFTLDNYFTKEEAELMADMLKKAFNNIAKAQLKKVAEYLDTFDFYKDWGGASGRMFRDEVRQALLEEVKDDAN